MFRRKEIGGYSGIAVEITKLAILMELSVPVTM
jgi:hypothetical protein